MKKVIIGGLSVLFMATAMVFMFMLIPYIVIGDFGAEPILLFFGTMIFSMIPAYGVFWAFGLNKYYE